MFWEMGGGRCVNTDIKIFRGGGINILFLEQADTLNPCSLTCGDQIKPKPDVNVTRPAFELMKPSVQKRAVFV